MSQVMEKKIENILQTVKVGTQNILDVKTVVADDGSEVTTLQWGERLLQPEPPELPVLDRSKARDHEFHSIESLVEYIETFCDSESEVVALADVTAEQIQVTLHESAAFGREVLTMRPMIDPRVQPWLDLVGKKLVVTAFASHCLMHRKQIVSPDPAEVVLIFSQISATSVITSNLGQGKNAINGVMIETKIGAGKTQSTPVDIPDSITVRAPLYIGTAVVDLEFDLLVKAQDPENVVVLVSSSDVMTRRVDAFLEMAARLQSIECVCAGLGRIRYEDWDTIEK